MINIFKYSFWFWFAFGIHYVDVNAQYSPALWIRQAGMNQFSADEPIVIYDGIDHIYFLGYFFKTFKYDDVILEEEGKANIFISKLDTLGNLVWIKRFWNNYGYGEKFHYYLNIWYAAVDKNQNIYFTGSFKDTIFAVDTTFYAVGEDHDIYMMKINPEGELEWFNNMGGGEPTYQRSTSLSIDENNDIILSTKDYWENFLFKFNPLGDLLWSKEYENLYDCYISSVVTDKENNIYISGTFEDYISFGNDTIFSMAGSDNNGFFAKFDENGDYIWSRLIGSYCENFHVSPYLRIDTSMNILVTCGIPNCAVYIGQDSIAPMDVRAKLMVMVNQEGNILWSHQAYSHNNIGMFANVLDNKNNIYCAVTYRNCSYVGFSDTIVPGEGAFLLIKLNQEGNIQWMKNQGGNISNNIWLRSLAPDFSDNLYVAGHFTGLAIFGDTSFYSAPYKKSIFLAKIDEYSWVKEPVITSISNHLNLAIGPNPVTNELYINLHTGEKVEYSIYSIYGNKIAFGFIENGQKILKMDTVTPGIYFLVIKGNGKESVFKFIKK
jgi:hypothetical protein